MTLSEIDMASTCKTRTLLELGCKGCAKRKECIKFKFCHNGVSPYEYSQLESKEDNGNEET
jgi:hypothetical protein